MKYVSIGYCLPTSIPFSSDGTIEPSSLLPSGDGAIYIHMAQVEASPATD